MISNLIPLQTFAQACKQSQFLGIKPWYQYIKSTPTKAGYCTLDFSTRGVGTVWLVLAGIIDILLRVGSLVAVGFFIYGAFRMITSQGSPEGVKGARNTMTNALVGLVICIVSSWVISYFIETVLA